MMLTLITSLNPILLKRNTKTPSRLSLQTVHLSEPILFRQQITSLTFYEEEWQVFVRG